MPVGLFGNLWDMLWDNGDSLCIGRGFVVGKAPKGEWIMCLYVAGLMLAGTFGLLTGCGIAAYRVTEAWNENERLSARYRTALLINDDLRAKNRLLQERGDDGVDVSFVRGNSE
jgi:hypothetical protein